MKSINAKKLFVTVSLFSFSFLFASCGVWRNFTTYFNTYYNAKDIFDQTEKQILLSKKDVFLFREDQKKNLTGTSPQNYQQANQPNYQQNVQQNYQQNYQQSAQNTGQTGALISGNVTENLKKVIEKCSKILQYDTESAYFTDALFMTGKALFYQGEYARAQRKFVELAGIPESDYALTNLLWLAKTNLHLREFDLGLKQLEEVKTKALEEEEEELFNDASITTMSFFLFREEYVNAISEGKSFLEKIDDDEMKALIHFQMGKIYKIMGDKNAALESYAKVLEQSPAFEVEFQSRLESAKLLKELNRVDESRTVLVDLSNQGKFVNFLDEILIELGQIYIESKEYKSALNLYMEVDSVYKLKPTGGQASLKLGEIYEKYYRDYDSAHKYYSKAINSQITPELKVEGNKRVRNLDKFLQLHKKINEQFVQIQYIDDPSKFLQDSIEYSIAFRDYTAEQKKRTDAQELASKDQSNTQPQLPPIVPPNPEDRRGMVLTPVQLIAINEYKQPERPALKADSVKSLLAKDYYDLGSLFFSELETPDSALHYYSKILKDYPNKGVHTQTLFAMGTYYETQNDSIKADSLYKIIYDNYEKDPLRNSAGEKLGLIKKEEKKVVVKTTDEAEPKYIEAEQLYFDKKYQEAIISFRKIIEEYPKSTFTPKSLLYIGYIYENSLNQVDSAASNYEKVVVKYDNTPYSRSVLDKISAYRVEKEKEKKEIELALKNKELEIQKAKTDSIAAVKQLTAQTDSTVIADSVNAVQKTEVEIPRINISPGTDSSKVSDIPIESDSTFIQSMKEKALKKEELRKNIKAKSDSTFNKAKLPD